MNSTMRERSLASLLLILLLTPTLLNQYSLIALSTFRPVGNIVNEINLGEGEPTSILYDPKNGYTYVGFASMNSSESGIYVIANYREVSVIPTALLPKIMCYNPQNGDVYGDLGSSISVINGTTIVSNITLNGSISTMLYDRLNGILYVYQAPWAIAVEGNSNIITPGIIYAINVSNNTVIGHVIIGKVNSQHMLLDPSNGYIYVSLMNGSIIIITPNLKIVGIINVNISVIYSMLYDPVNGYIYVDGRGLFNSVGELVVINPSSNSVIGSIPVFSYDSYLFSEPLLTYNPSNGYVYVVDGNGIGVISSNNLVATIPVGSQTFAVTYSPENNYVYVSANGTISVIDPEYDFVISNLTAPNDLVWSLMTYGNGYIYVADYLTNGTTQVIIIGLQSAQKEEGSLVVNVYNYTLGSPVVGGITYGLLINSENQVVEKAYINNYSQLVFTNVTRGQYVVDVYHIPSSGMNITEYWGNITVNVTSLPYTVNFTRNTPVIYSLNYTLVNGTYNVNAVIYNPRNYSIEATVYFYTPSSLIPASIERYLAPGYNYFSLGVPSSTPYVDVVVSAYLSNYLGTPIPTDEKVLRFVTETPIEQVVLNLLNGQQYFGVPHVYQGDNNGFPKAPTNKWPVYYGPNNASQYWSQGNITSDQPVLELVPGIMSGGAMFWNETYSNGSITITIQATASKIFGGGAPFQVYLFLKPTMWNISPQYNYSIPYVSDYPSPVGVDTIFPQSSTPYIVVQWNPAWQPATTLNGATGQWNVWIVSNPSGNNASVGPYPSPNLGPGVGDVGWDGIGTGYIQPNPGDRINITVTYNPSTNTLSGVATDLSASCVVLLYPTVQTICPKATFTLNLSGYFTPPSSGNYVFGVGAGTLDIYGGNGALLYVAMMGNVSSPSPSPTYYSVKFTEVGLPPGTAWNVTLNGVTNASSNSSMIFTVPNGEYNYSVTSPIFVNGVEYVATKASGTITVNGTNVTITVQYVPVSTTEKLEVYSEFVKYFYSGFNLPNEFFVAAPNINGKQPSSVTGYIAGTNVALNFTYNSSIGYWVSNEVNMGALKPGSYELTVYAVYGNNYVVEGTYNITVLEPPPIVLTILSYIPIPNQAFELKLSNLGGFSIPLDIGYEWSLEKNITGLFNNTYEIKAKVILKYELEQNIPVNYLSGNYSTSLEFPIFVTLDSNGTVSIGGGISKNLVLQFGPANAAFTVGGSAQGNLAISNYRVVLQTIDASAFLSAYGTYNIPTPWAIPIDDMGVVGFTVSISLGASAHVKAVLIPVNNPNSTIPLAFKDVSGNVFIPFGIEGSLDAYILGVGAAGGLQGAAGVGFLLQPGGSSLLESPGGAMVGEVNAFVVVNLIIISYQGSWTILGPGVLYEWGSVPNSDIVSFENELQQAAQQFQQQVTSSDWVNGSTFGIITNNTRFGYGFSITDYNGLVYIYYTKLTPSGVAVIRGLVFNGTTAMNASLPVFNDSSEGSPLLVKLSNGSLMMVWDGVPIGHYNLSNLTILLQGSVLHGNTWGPVVNLTTSGDAMSYASDGKYIYLDYEPKLSLTFINKTFPIPTYNNTILEELTPTGVVVKALSIPRVLGITGAWNGSVVVQFINGTYALVNMNTGAVEPIKATIAGFSNGLLYYFYNGKLTVVNGTQRLTISLPNYAYAFPVAWSRGLVVIAWRPGLLSVFNWNGTALQPIRNYTTAFTIVPRATIINNTLYLAWFALENITNGHGTIYMAILPLNTTTTTTVNVTTTTSSASTSTSISTGTITTTTTTSSSTSSVTTPTTSSMTNSVKPSPSALPTWIAVAVVAVVVVVSIAALLIIKHRKP
jgi:hypothetical protein